MKKESVPALGIMKTEEFKDATFYLINCECDDISHQQRLVVSQNKDDGDIEISIFSTQKYKHRFLSKIKQIIKIIFSKEIEYESELIIRKEVAISYANEILKFSERKVL